MRALARQIITTAAMAAGISEADVIDKPKRQTNMLPKPRLEFETLTQDMDRDGKLFARLPGSDPDVYSKHRKRLYKLKLNIRAVIRAETAEDVESLYKAFILALPVRTSDGDNNLVTVNVERLERGGFESQLVEVMGQRDVSLLITFEGGIYQDSEIPWVKEVDVKSNLTINP